MASVPAIVGTNCATGASPSLAFYMYADDPSLNHHWMRHCARFKELRAASKAENTAEVGLHKVLRNHPLRTRDPALARFFYVPIFEYTSKYVAHHCANTSSTPEHLRDHAARMASARTALQASQHWRAHGGRDHIWASTAFSAHSYTLEKRMQPLSGLLSCSAVGRYKAGPFSRASAGGACVVEVPYQASLHVMRAWQAARHTASTDGGVRDGSQHSHRHLHRSINAAAAAGAVIDVPKPTLLFFAGSLDVCCTGKVIRCAIADLHAASIGQADVNIRPTGNGPCTRRALELAARNSSSQTISQTTVASTSTATTTATSSAATAVTATTATTAARGSGGASASITILPGAPADGLSGTARYVSGGLVERTAHEMTASTWCLCPAGDTCVTSRLYTAIAAGCLPIVLCDQLVGAFAASARYETFWIKFPTRTFQKSPRSLLELVRTLSSNATEMARRQAALASARADVLYDEPGSRVGTHFLTQIATRCTSSVPPPPMALVTPQGAAGTSDCATATGQHVGKQKHVSHSSLRRGAGGNETTRTAKQLQLDQSCLRRGGIAVGSAVYDGTSPAERVGSSSRGRVEAMVKDSKLPASRLDTMRGTPMP